MQERPDDPIMVHMHTNEIVIMGMICDICHDVFKAIVFIMAQDDRRTWINSGISPETDTASI